MYKKIIFNKNLPLKQRLKNFTAYWSKRRGARIGWRKRFKKVFELHQEYKKPVEKTAENEHREYWRFFSKKANLDTLRLSGNISGNANPKYVPEEVFVADIEPTLNKEKLEAFLEIKNFYNHWFGKSCAFPEIYINKIDGVYYDGETNRINESDLEKIFKKMPSDFVLKPSKDSYGGKGVLLSPSKKLALNALKKAKNAIVQERIFLHEKYTEITKGKDVSTRILMYKSVKTDIWQILSHQHRCSVGNSLASITDGAIVTCVDEFGSMDGYATDSLGKKFFFHPDTRISFDLVVPEVEQLKKIIAFVCNKIFFSRIFSLDLVLDQKGNWRMIEVNLRGITIRNPQYHGMPVFGEFTDEVVEYCKTNHWALK